MKISTPLKRVNLLFPSKPPLKIEVLPKFGWKFNTPPAPPQQKRGGGAHYEHKNFVLLSKHIAIMWKSSEIFQSCHGKDVRCLGSLCISCLLEHKFHLNKSWIFLANYRVQKLRTNTCLSKTSKAKTCFVKINCHKLKNEINEIINWTSNMSKTRTKEYIWQI